MSKKRVHPRQNAETRLAKRVLEGLMGSADDELEEFREWRVKDKSLALTHLVRARDLLDRIAEVIQAGDAKAWKQLEGAWRVLGEDADAKRVQSDIERAAGDGEVPVLATRGCDRGVANEAQRLGAEFTFKPLGRANLRSFLDRALRARCHSALRRWLATGAMRPA